MSGATEQKKNKARKLSSLDGRLETGGHDLYIGLFDG
jgi:hypothetical protein